jgi:serine/threonine-protein kinase RsbW
MTTGVNTSLPAPFGATDGLLAFAECERRELPAGGETAGQRAGAPAGDGRASPEISTRLCTGARLAGWQLRTVRSSRPAGLRGFAGVYPGTPKQVGCVRADLEAVLSGCPVADEAILVASELAANAVTHSSSREPGGRFVVRADVCPGDYVWIEVEDQGGTGACYHPRDGRPHGLDIVQAIAGEGNWGVDGDGLLGRVAWARLDWPGR